METKSHQQPVVMPPVPYQSLGQPQIVVLRSSDKVDQGKSKRILVLGATQVTTGILMLLTDMIAIYWSVCFSAWSAHGCWNGIFIIIAGSFGIAASKKMTRCYVITFLVLSIISSIGVWGVLSMGITNIAWNEECESDGSVFANAMLILTALVGFIIAIAASVVCCRAVCCDSSQVGIQVGYQQNGQIVIMDPSHSQQVVVMPPHSQTAQFTYVQPGMSNTPAFSTQCGNTEKSGELPTERPVSNPPPYTY